MPNKEVATISVESHAFGQGAAIPLNYTCIGEDVSPPLIISELPIGTKSLAIIFDDPDAPMGTFVHWIAWNIDPSDSILDEGAHVAMKQGMNDFGRQGYRGPCPPAGKIHHYFFKIYALDTMLDLPDGSTKKELEASMSGHILGQGELMGVFQR